MNVTEILKKVLAGKSLSEAERKALGEFRPEGIPQSRLDTEIAKRKELETENSKLNSTLVKLNSRVDELENRDLSEQEKLEKSYSAEVEQLRENVSVLTAERDSSRQELEQVRFQQQVGKLAEEKKFNDPEYLGFLLKQSRVPLNAEEEVDKFISELREKSPKLFRLELRSGSGSNPGGSEIDFSAALQSGDISTMLANAPEIN
jgi:chromosome segregation ATPase